MQPDTDTPIFEDINIPPVTNDDIMAELLRQREAINQIGVMLQSMIDTVSSIAAQFQGQSPMQLLKGLMTGGK